MATLTKEQVHHIAKLARLSLSDEEVGRYATELTAILGYVSMLQEVDTSGVEPAAQATGLSNSFRKDDLWKQALAEPDALLQTSPLPIVERQIVTPSSHDR